MVLFVASGKDLLWWHHTVTLQWEESTSLVEGYNVYRRELPNGATVKVNKQLVKGDSFVDKTVVSGKRYRYTVKSYRLGKESVDSNPAEADVP